MTRVTQANFARMIGVNRSTVHRWIANGRIETDAHGLIDPEAAARMRDATESKSPHHQARKKQWEMLRGMTIDEMKYYHAEISARKKAINEQIKAKNADLRRLRHETNVRVRRENEKQKRGTPEYMEYARLYQKRISEDITDAYVTKILKKEFVTPDLLELKRQQLFIKRALKDLNAVIADKKEHNHE